MADLEAKKIQGTEEVLKAIAAMDEPDKAMGERLHKVITTSSYELVPRTWYGMPAYSIKTENSGDKIVCFFRNRSKFGERYMTLGFNDVAKFDDGNMWPISYALTDVTEEVEKRVAVLVKKAVA